MALISTHLVLFRPGFLFCRVLPRRGQFGKSPRRAAAVERQTSESEPDFPDAGHVRYLPPLNTPGSDSLQVVQQSLGAAQVMPCFPLGLVTYVPETEQVLQIFEPRYREMYNDIIASGGRRFVVPQVTQDKVGNVRLSEVGVVFYLTDLREVSEQTQDRFKYVCQHSVISRVRIKKVLNPGHFINASTYLRVQYEPLVDDDEGVDYDVDEREVMNLAADMVKLQKRAEGAVDFNSEFVGVNATRAGFWNLANRWQNYYMHRAQSCQSEFEEAAQLRIQKYFADRPAPAEFARSGLPNDVLKDVALLQQRFRDDVESFMGTQSHGIQLLLQTESHGKRLSILKQLLSDEVRRLVAKESLKSIFVDDGAYSML